jgi:D-alanyl-D-alanine carboxypeptidase/D-alanyl-D-alanine-endopeptidase (penicillin-binding protein 4)
MTVAPGEPTEIVSSFLPESRRWVVTGSVLVGEKQTLTLAARDPVRLAAGALARALEESGIALEGGVQIEWGEQGDATTPGANSTAPGGDAIAGGESGSARNVGGPGGDGTTALLRIAGLTSPPLAEVMHVLLDTSQNWMTEQLVRTLGAELGEGGSWREGFRVIEGHLALEVGIDSLDLHMEDGSGLSAYNLLTPRAVVRILAHAQSRPWGDSFRTSLPTPGRTGGTLDGRLPGLAGRLHAKTGTIMNVNSLSGYLVTNEGRELIFSILTNGSNLPAARVRERMDALVTELAAGP